MAAASSLPHLVQYVYDLPMSLTIRTVGDLTTTVDIIPSNYTLSSIATLRGAQFSNNSYMECYTLEPFITSNKTIVIEGIM